MVVMRFRELFERHDTEEINILHRNQWLAILGELFPHITKEEADEIFDKTCGNGTHVDVIDYQKILSQMQGKTLSRFRLSFFSGEVLTNGKMKKRECFHEIFVSCGIKTQISC